MALKYQLTLNNLGVRNANPLCSQKYLNWPFQYLLPLYACFLQISGSAKDSVSSGLCSSVVFFFVIFFFPFICWRLITLQYCGDFYHTLTWISHDLHEFPIPIPPPTSLSTRSLWFIWIITNEMDETGAHCTEWSKPER